jgi:hypothetical protein
MLGLPIPVSVEIQNADLKQISLSRMPPSSRIGLISQFSIQIATAMKGASNFMSVKVENISEPEAIVKVSSDLMTNDSRVRFVTAEELGVEMVAGTSVAVPAEIKARVNEWVSDYKSFLVGKTEDYIEKRAALARRSNGHKPGIETGEPTVGNYVGWDLVSFSPIQPITFPPYEPHKIIAGGELAFLTALLFINPTVSIPDGFAIPANVQLGDRDFRVSFDQLNLSTATPGPNFVFVGNFGPAPVPSLIFFAVPFIANPVPTPQLVEVNVTADILDLGQPYAAFATWHVDIDREPPFLGLPPVPPQLEHDIPQRYMIYPK